MVGRKAEYTITGSSQLAWKEPRKKNYPYGKKTKEKYKNGSFQSSTNRIDREDRERRGRKKE